MISMWWQYSSFALHWKAALYVDKSMIFASSFIMNYSCLPILAIHVMYIRRNYIRRHSSMQEVALVGLLGYLSYLCGELLGLSGIVCVFCCAVAISHYALHNVSSVSRVTLVSAFQTLSYLSEGAIFIYVGMDLLDPLKWKVRIPYL